MDKFFQTTQTSEKIDMKIKMFAITIVIALFSSVLLADSHLTLEDLGRVPPFDPLNPPYTVDPPPPLPKKPVIPDPMVPTGPGSGFSPGYEPGKGPVIEHKWKY